jgi:hypothetical protein
MGILHRTTPGGTTVVDRETLEGEGRPVVAGLVALVGVGLVVGLIAALATLAGTRILGFGGETATAEDRPEQSMYLPKPKRTEASDGPLITLEAEPTQDGDEKERSEPSESESSKPQKAISLSVSQSEVAPMQQIDLTGVYPQGEGAILRVERFANGRWEDFAQITANVSNQTFATYIQTGQVGVQRFRVVDTDTGKASNEVRVTVG